MAQSSSPSPSMKLVTADPKPKSGANSASSSSATSTPPAPLEKRTRDQPNLSDCHCCSRRIISTNPKDRLQPLDSVWRIVLLCRKCRRSVCSGQTCPYCFQAMGNSGELCTCKVCERKIHKDCVRDYGKCKPWCYLEGGAEGFRVCVDCWVPELLKKPLQVLGRSESRDGLKEKGEGKDLSENGKCEGVKKVKKKGKAKEQGPRRAKGAIGEANLVNGQTGASDLVAKNDRDSSKVANSGCNGETEVVDDAKLAIQLHRVINSSPRILMGKTSGGSSSLDARRSRNWKGLSYKRSGLGKRCSEDRKRGVGANSVKNGRMNDSSLGMIPYKRDRKRKRWQLENENIEISESTHIRPSEDSVYAYGGRSNSSIEGGKIELELIRSYKRKKFRKNVRPLNGLVAVSGDNNSCGNHGEAFKPENCQLNNANVFTSSLVKRGTKEILQGGGSEWDRYQMKYVRRIPGTQHVSSFQHYATFFSEDQDSAPARNSEFPVNDCEMNSRNGTGVDATDPYLFKYARRAKSSKSGSSSDAKPHYNTFFSKIDPSANYSAESRTVSDVSFDSITVDLPQ